MMEKNFNPKEIEEKLYKEWIEKGYFTPEIDESKEPFTIVIPPPNITGVLHMGHALDNTLQDILIRWKRMQGVPTLWLPGTDHAAIATEAKIVRSLEKDGKTKAEIGREKFMELGWEWKENFGGTIIEQLKKLGCSCDWTRTRFTMDEGLSNAVKEVFVRLYEKGLIYRGVRIVNWCPDCKTSISDIEIEYSEKASHLWHIKYPIENSDNEYITVATTRPETMLGDTAVAVNPNDDRYKDLVGKNVILPLINKPIPVIADEYVDMEFGTGMVKITPAHDPNDFEIGLRHNLEQITVIDDIGKMNENAGKYQGMDSSDARKQIVKELEKLGLLEKIEDYTHNVGECYRCSTVIEPKVSEQWFVKMEPLAKPAIDVVKKGEVKFVPSRFDKTYFNWMENIQDWCISRQIWWGHRIPAYYCDDCGEMMVSREDVKVCTKCGSSHVRQDEDTLDTWFSSALWPFSTLGWPEQTKDLEYFYPTNVLVTGYDIITFWVSKMIFSALEFTGQKPFDDVLIHGLVRDAQGRKMSKSLGNGINPLEIIEEYSSDALRFALATGNSPGNDMRFTPERIESSRNFTNKIWNAARFIEMNLDINENKLPNFDKLTVADKWILSRYNEIISEVTENLEKFEIGVAAQKLYAFVWDEFCDWYIELTKSVLYDKESQYREGTQQTLVYVLSNTLKLLHPFMPFITETIWRALPHIGESIMISDWPQYKKELEFEVESKKMNMIMETIKSIRNRRSEMDVPAAQKIKAIIVTEDIEDFEDGKDYIMKLAGVGEIVIQNNKEGITASDVTIVTANAEVFLPLDKLVDKEKEIERLSKEKEKLESEINRVNGKLSNQGFVSKAPQKVVDEEKAKKEKYEEMLKKVEERLEMFK